MTLEEMKEDIDILGMKAYVISAACGMHPSLLSKHLNQKRPLPPDKAKRVEIYLVEAKEALSKVKASQF